MDYSLWFVCLMGMGTVFFGLVCIIILTKLMSAVLGKKPELGYMTMDGQEVFKFAVKKVPQCITEVLEDTGVKAEDVRYFAIHQANYRIAEAIAKRLKVSMEQIPTNMEHYGNTSGASIPLLLDELNRAGKIQKGDLLVLAGFGAGLTWGATLVRW